MVGDVDDDYLRALQVAGLIDLDASLTIRPLGVAGLRPLLSDSTPHPWKGRWLRSFADPASFGLTPASARLVYNSNFPESRNEGAVMPGRHLTQIFDLGAWARMGPLQLTLRPTLAWVQNGEFRLASGNRNEANPYMAAWRAMDRPQRFGPDPYWVIDPGQSEIRLEAKGVAASFGTTNLWWGPGMRNALLMSNNAAGFPHLSIASARPVKTGIGRFEGQWIFGRLQASDWFTMPADAEGSDTGRYITAAVVTYSPDRWGLEGLTLGGSRVFYAMVPDDGIGLSEYTIFFQTPFKNALKTDDNPLGDDRRDQMISVFGRWVLPESGFELYAEWGRNDHGENLRDYFLHADHTQAYTLGLQKTIEPSAETLVRLRAELTHLETPADSEVRVLVPWYEHGFVYQGYTQRGQVIGAALGPGGNGQFLGVDVHTGWGQAGAWVQRTVADRDIYRRLAGADPENWGYWRIDASRTLALNLRLFAGDWDLVGEAWYTRNFNRYYNFDSDQSNYRLDFSVRRRWGSPSSP